MAYTPITSTEIAVGEPVRSDTQTKIADNFENHESRILGIETGAGTVYPPIILRVNGYYSTLGAYPRATTTTCNFNLTITGIRLLIDVAGSSGTTEVDVLYKRGGGSWTSVLTTKPSVVYSAGDNAISTNAVLNLGQVALQAGDLIRLDITSTQAGAANGFSTRIDFNKS
jgi:hypothetical protein